MRIHYITAGLLLYPSLTVMLHDWWVAHRLEVYGDLITAGIVALAYAFLYLITRKRKDEEDCSC